PGTRDVRDPQGVAGWCSQGRRSLRFRTWEKGIGCQGVPANRGHECGAIHRKPEACAGGAGRPWVEVAGGALRGLRDPSRVQDTPFETPTLAEVAGHARDSDETGARTTASIQIQGGKCSLGGELE